MSTLEGVRTKLHRAYAHITELDRLLHPIEELATDTLWCDPNTDRTELVYRVGKLPEVPAVAAAVVGDAIFNMRSALDQLAYGLKKIDDIKRTTKKTQFPLCAARDHTATNPCDATIHPGIKRVDILKAVRDAQPCNRLGPNSPAIDDALIAINQLNNRDKHRMLLTMTTNLDHASPLWLRRDGEARVIQPRFFATARPLHPGAAIAKFTFDGPAPDDFDPNMSLVVALNEGPPKVMTFRFERVAALLMDLLDREARIIDLHFLRFYPGEPSIVGGLPDLVMVPHHRIVVREPDQWAEGPGFVAPPRRTGRSTRD